MALSVGPVHKLQHCSRCSSQRHFQCCVVHRKRHLYSLENLLSIVVDTRKTYVLLSSVPSPILIDLCIYSGCWKKHHNVSYPLIHFGPDILSNLIKALLSSSTSMTSLMLVQSSLPSSFSTSRTLPSRVSVLCCLLSSSSSTISQTASTTFSFTFILHTRMARSNLISKRLHAALKTRSGLQEAYRST